MYPEDMTCFPAGSRLLQISMKCIIQPDKGAINLSTRYRKEPTTPASKLGKNMKNSDKVSRTLILCVLLAFWNSSCHCASIVKREMPVEPDVGKSEADDPSSEPSETGDPLSQPSETDDPPSQPSETVDPSTEFGGDGPELEESSQVEENGVKGESGEPEPEEQPEPSVDELPEPQKDIAKTPESGFIDQKAGVDSEVPASKKVPKIPVQNVFPFLGGFVFDSPFFNFKQVEDYFRRFERAMVRVFKQTMSDAEKLPNSEKKSKDEVVDIDGKKYNVHSEFVKGGDVNDSVSIKVVSAEPAQKTKGSLL